MKPTRPDLPKRLAARIRAAQLMVEQDRSSVIHTEQSIADGTERINEFEADPPAFARKHYRNHGVDSYPVTTNIARTRERLEYDVCRQPVRIERLVVSEQALLAVEAEVLREVEAMRPTKGRVPWPPPLPTMKRFREITAEAEQRWQEEDRRERAEWAIKEAAEAEQRRIEYERESDANVADFQREFALLPPEEQARYNEGHAKIIAMVESGELSKADLFNAVLDRLNR